MSYKCPDCKKGRPMLSKQCKKCGSIEKPYFDGKVFLLGLLGIIVGNILFAVIKSL